MKNAERYKVSQETMNKVNAWKDTSFGCEKTVAEWKTENEELCLKITDLQEKLKNTEANYHRRFDQTFDLKCEINELKKQLESENLRVNILRSQKDRLPEEIQKENEEFRLENLTMHKIIDSFRNKIYYLIEDNKALYSSQVETEKTNDDLKKKYDTLMHKYKKLDDQFQSSMQDSWQSNHRR
jgi:chromosome segregation ATPase